MPETSESMCSATISDVGGGTLYCTREYRHDGRHEARNMHREIVASWPEPAAPAALPPVPVGRKPLSARARAELGHKAADEIEGRSALLAHGGATEGGETALDERLDELFALGGDFEMATTEGAASLAAEGDRITAEIRDLFARQASALADARAALTAERADKRGAERLAREVNRLVLRRIIDARSPAADALLDYAPHLVGPDPECPAALPTPRASEVER